MSINIAIANQKGGVGKTTTVIDLAASLAALKKKVLVVDLDQSGNLTTYVDADTSMPSIYNVLNADVPISDSLQKIGKYSFIASSKELSKGERQFVDYDDIFLLKDVIDAVGDEYDFVLIDNGPSRSILLTMSYVAADYIISPTDCDDGSIDGIKEVYADLQEIRAKKRPISKAKLLGILLTKYERTIMHQEAENTIEEIANETDDKPFVMTIRKAITASESKSARESMQEYQHNSNPAADYRAVAKMIVKKTGVK